MKKNHDKNGQQKDHTKPENAESEATATENEAALPEAEQAESDPLAKLEAELSVTKDKYLRLYSDFDNYKKRIARDRIDLITSAGSDVMMSILPVIDDMERALKAMSDAPEIKAVKDGVQLVYQKLKTITESKGLKAMESVGKPFDSDLHDAITNLPAPTEDMKGKVVEEIEKGYFLNEKVIRHAKVIVGN